ncbi:hypothetical protein, unlikely [Trypanosoma congolense IL3000]|uniref:Uncharacterized protein n=1 Tax=Trypanosoma congolense (strain IL3000) TaxID=1068625 RepID=F9WBU4_TRYCI|nr:hypothetical protein, unlikely [Trypanosoma congolense IL3000]
MKMLPSILAAEHTPARMLLAGLCGMVGGDPMRQAGPMLHWELGLICGTFPLERDGAALRLAWVTASGLGEMAQPRNRNLVPHPHAKDATVVGCGDTPKDAQKRPTQSCEVRCNIGGRRQKDLRDNQRHGR